MTGNRKSPCRGETLVRPGDGKDQVLEKPLPASRIKDQAAHEVRLVKKIMELLEYPFFRQMIPSP
jgi:hypothetical protein